MNKWNQNDFVNQHKKMLKICMTKHLKINIKLNKWNNKWMKSRKTKISFLFCKISFSIQEEDDELRTYAEAKKKIARIRRQKELEAHQ